MWRNYQRTHQRAYLGVLWVGMAKDLAWMWLLDVRKLDRKQAQAQQSVLTAKQRRDGAQSEFRVPPHD